MYPRALEELQAALDDPRRPLPQEQRAQVAGLVDQSKAFVGRYQLEIEPADAELLVDGTRRSPNSPLVLGVRVHQLILRATGAGEVRRELIVQGREDETLALELFPPKPDPKPAPAPAAAPAALAAAAPPAAPAAPPAALAPAPKSPSHV